MVFSLNDFPCRRNIPYFLESVFEKSCGTSTTCNPIWDRIVFNESAVDSAALLNSRIQFSDGVFLFFIFL